MRDHAPSYVASESVPVVPARLDSPTGPTHAALVSALSRLVYEYLCSSFPTQPLCEVATISAGGTPSKSRPDYWDGDVPWIAPRDMKTFLSGESSSRTTRAAIDAGAVKLNKAPCTILVTRGMILARYVPVVHVGVDAATNQDVRACKTKGVLSGKFLSAMLLGAERRIFSVVTDSTAGQKRIESESLEALPIPVVASEEAQKAIAKFVADMSSSLESMQQAVEHAPPVLAALHGDFKRLFTAALKLEEMKSVRAAVLEELSGLLASAFCQVADGAPRRPLGEVAPLTRRPAEVLQDENYPQIAVRSFGRGTFNKPDLDGGDITWEKPFRVEKGDILISNIKAWEGAIAVVDDADHGRFASHRYLTCVADPSIAAARYVYYYLLTPEGLQHVGEASPGSADRNRTLGAKALQAIPVPVPSLEAQRWFERLLLRVEQARQLHKEAVDEQELLLPSVTKSVFKARTAAKAVVKNETAQRASRAS